MLTETHVPATDRRARFVGVEAYTEAGGTILRDLFTEDRGGYLEDVALLNFLVMDGRHFCHFVILSTGDRPRKQQRAIPDSVILSFRQGAQAESVRP
jgi:hypothetical protein